MLPYPALGTFRTSERLPMGLEHSCSPRSKTSIKNQTASLNISNRQSCSRTLCSAQLRTALTIRPTSGDSMRESRIRSQCLPYWGRCLKTIPPGHPWNQRTSQPTVKLSGTPSGQSIKSLARYVSVILMPDLLRLQLLSLLSLLRRRRLLLLFPPSPSLPPPLPLSSSSSSSSAAAPFAPPFLLLPLLLSFFSLLLVIRLLLSFFLLLLLLLSFFLTLFLSFLLLLLLFLVLPL